MTVINQTRQNILVYILLRMYTGSITVLFVSILPLMSLQGNTVCQLKVWPVNNCPFNPGFPFTDTHLKREQWAIREVLTPLLSYQAKSVYYLGARAKMSWSGIFLRLDIKPRSSILWECGTLHFAETNNKSRNLSGIHIHVHKAECCSISPVSIKLLSTIK